MNAILKMCAMIKKAPQVLLSVLLGSMPLSSHGESLLEVYRQVQQNNPDLRAAAAKSGEVRAGIDQVRGSLLPQLSLEANYYYTNKRDVDKSPPSSPTSGMYTTTNRGSLNLILRQSILDFSKWSELSVAKQKAARQDLDYKVSQQKLMLDTASHYVRVLVALERLNRVTNERLALARKLQETQQQHRVGVAPPTDLYNAQSKYDTALANEVQSGNEVENTLERLRQISGHYYYQLNCLENHAVKPQPLHGTLEAWLQNSKQHNLTLLAARLTQQTVLESVRGAKNRHLPTLNLEAQASHQQHAGKHEKDNHLSGSINLYLPIFSGWQVTTEVKRTQFALLQADEGLESVRREVFRETREAYNGVNTAISGSIAYQQAVDSAQLWLHACEAGYRVGTETLVKALQARADLFAAKESLAQARYDYFINQLKLKAAAGQLTEQDLQELDQQFKVTIPTRGPSTPRLLYSLHSGSGELR